MSNTAQVSQYQTLEKCRAGQQGGLKVSELIYNLVGFVTTDQSTNCFKVRKTESESETILDLQTFLLNRLGFSASLTAVTQCQGLMVILTELRELRVES